MDRRDFIVKSGTLLTATAFMTMLPTSIFGNSFLSETKENGIGDKRPNPNDFKQAIMKAIAYGVNAPNPHNTQAWKFKILNDKEALLYVDETRILAETDPPTRQIHIGCGAFLETLKIGSSKVRYKTTIEYLPEGEYGLSKVGEIPVARISVQEENITTDPLFDYIYTRQTNRGYYKGNIISNAEFESILKATQSKHSEINVFNKKQELKDLLLLLYKGMEVEMNDFPKADESRIWMRIGKKEIAKYKDGINMHGNGMPPLQRKVAERLLRHHDVGSFHEDGSVLMYEKNHYDTVMSSKGVVTLKTSTNNMLDWIKCGQDYARFQLSAFANGFSVSPLSQVLQEYSSMETLYNEFNEKMNIKGQEKIQMAVRIGRAKEVEYSFRRDINQFTKK